MKTPLFSKSILSIELNFNLKSLPKYTQCEELTLEPLKQLYLFYTVQVEEQPSPSILFPSSHCLI